MPIILIIIFVSTFFWPISVSIVIVIIVSIIVVRKQKKNKLYISLNTEKKQEDFEKETGYKPIENGKFTKRYKSWLIRIYDLSRDPYRQPVAYEQPPKQEVVEEKKICTYCGVENVKSAKFCDKCGNPFDKNSWKYKEC